MTSRTRTRTAPAPAIVLVALLLSVAVAMPGCGDDRTMPNSPYPAEESDRGIYYTTYIVAPKTLDPARAYSSDLYDIIGPIYEPPLGYHVFTHPTRQVTPLIPKTAVALPEPVFQLKRRIHGEAIGGTWMTPRAQRDDKGAATTVRLDIGSRSGVEVGEQLEFHWVRTDLPAGESSSGLLLEVRDVDEYACEGVLVNEPASDPGGVSSALDGAGSKRGWVHIVRDWSTAKEVELREFINERDRQTQRDAALGRWRERWAGKQGEQSQTQAARDGGAGRFACPPWADEITFPLPEGWHWRPAAPAQNRPNSKLTMPSGMKWQVHLLSADETRAHRWHPDHPVRVNAARDLVTELLGGEPMVVVGEVVAGGRIPVAVAGALDPDDDNPGGAKLVGAVIERNRALIFRCDTVAVGMGACNELLEFLRGAGSARLPLGAADAQVLVDVHIRPGIYYAPHPCFAKDDQREDAFRWHPGFRDAAIVNRLRRLADELAKPTDRDAGTILALRSELATRGLSLTGDDADELSLSVQDALNAHGHWLTHTETSSKFRISDFDYYRGVSVVLDQPLSFPLDGLDEYLGRHLHYEFDAGKNRGEVRWYGVLQPEDRRALEALAPSRSSNATGHDQWLTIVDEIAKKTRRVATRELTAADYVLQIKRMANPLTQCPILEPLERYVVGFDDYHAKLAAQLRAERERRQHEQGVTYSQEVDERENPIRLDLDAAPCPGIGLVRADDRYTFRIKLNQPWPQLRYWLAMPFFAPIPWEAVSFFQQAPLAANDITLTRFPVGTGPYRLSVFDRTREVRLVRNECYRRDPFPTIWDDDYNDLSMTDTLVHLAPGADTTFHDAGGMMPFMDEVVFKLEKEAVPRWHKFVLGYYDKSVIGDDQFEGVVDVGADGMTLRNEMADRRITMDREPVPTIYYFGFNMRDPVLGGPTLDEALSEKKCKLRQALSIILDIEEFNNIFYNGRYMAAQGPIPPGILGNRGDQTRAFNPFIYNWNDAAGKRVRKSVDAARQLLAEAGYPDGKDETGQVLTIHFDCSWVGPAYQTRFDWMKKRFDLLGINFKERATDYNRYQSKIDAGKHEMFFWGWNADYPDPENFLFLFYGPNRGTPLPGDDRGRGPNSANYENPEYDRLFERMATMPDDIDVEDWSAFRPRTNGRPETRANGISDRLEIIQIMIDILRHDSPWSFGFYRVAMSLRHQWVRNGHVNELAQDILKYRRIDIGSRQRYRKRFNEPVWWPLWTLLAIAILTAVPAVITVWRRNNSVV